MAKMTKRGQTFVGDEISHLMKDGPSKGPQKDKKMPQKQAIAVALDVARRKGFKTAPRKEEDMSIFDSIIKGNAPKSIFDGIVESKTKSIFDGIVESKTESENSNWDDRVARTLTLSEELVGIRDRVKQ